MTSTSLDLPRWKLWFFSLVLLLFGLAILELGAQSYLRLAKGYSGGSFLQYEFDPYKNIQPTRGWTDARGVRHNSQGFRRDGDVEQVKPEGTLRIFLMGASTAYGTGGLWPHIQKDFDVLDNSETIDHYLEELLQREYPTLQVEVINAAIPSVWTHHHLIALNQTILRYDPDLILFLDGLNDHFYYDRNHDQFTSYAYGEQSRVIMGPPTLTSLVRMNTWWFFRKSAFAHIAVRAAENLAGLLSGRENPEPIDVVEAIESVQWVFERNALRMIERNALILEQEGIPAIFMLQPMLVLERGRYERMAEVERQLFDFNMDATEANYEKYISQASPIIAQMIDQTVRPLGATFLDLTQTFDDAEGQIFTDYAHLTPLGNRLLAETVSDAVIASISQGIAATSPVTQEPQ